MIQNQLLTQPLSGVGYLLKGAKLISHPKLRLFVLIPLMNNILIFAGAFWFLFSSITQLIDSYMAALPELLSWLKYLLWPILVLTILFAFTFIFSAVANFIAAPFNGLLAEKTEIVLTNQPLDDSGLSDLVKDLPRIFKRELQKLAYFLPRMVFCGLLFLIPGFGQIVAPFIWFVFAGWMMVIQYADFPFDNHKIPFATMKQALRKRLGKNLTFGILVSLFTTLPVINFIIMPIAVCGATAFWVDVYKQASISSSTPPEVAVD